MSTNTPRCVQTLTPVQSGDETPVPRVDTARLRVPARPPFHTVPIRAPVPFRPEAEVERRDEENPAETLFCERVRR